MIAPEAFVKRSCFLCVSLFVVVSLVGCSGRISSNTSPGDSAQTALQTLRTYYERQNDVRFGRLIHSDYDDGRRNKSDLRFDVSDVMDQYSNVELTLYGLRETRSDQTVAIQASWNLRWTCARTGPGCSSSGKTVLRRGRTTFDFVKTDGMFQLISQRGDRVFGTLDPGRVTN